MRTAQRRSWIKKPKAREMVRNDVPRINVKAGRGRGTHRKLAKEGRDEIEGKLRGQEISKIGKDGMGQVRCWE